MCPGTGFPVWRRGGDVELSGVKTVNKYAIIVRVQSMSDKPKYRGRGNG